MIKRIRMGLTMLMVGTMLIAAGCSSSTTSSNDRKTAAPPAEPTKKVLNISLNADPPNLDPNKSSAVVDRMVQNSIYDKLFDLDKDGNIVPMLAESYTVSDDGKTYTFKLKSGVKFQDGTDFNADAVKFNMERNKGETSKRRSEMKFVNSVTVVDPLTVKVELSSPFSPFLSILTDRSGMMVSPAAVQKYGDDYVNNPVGTGPFVFVEHIKGDHITLKQNENYWNGKPKIDELNYRVFTNGTAAVQNLRSGQLDIVTTVPTKEIPSVEKDGNLSVVAEASQGFSGFYINTQKDPFTNKYLRQAVDRAIDRETLVKVLYEGYALPGNSPFGPGNLAYGDSDKVKKPDDAEIKDLLAKGGKPNGFTFTMQIGTSPESEQYGAILQGMLKKFNIDMKLEKTEFGAMLENADKGSFQASAINWSGRPDPDQNFYDFVVSDGSNNRSKINIPELDKLITQARSELDNGKRKELYEQAMALLHEEPGYAYLFHGYNIYGINKKVTGFTYVPDGIVRAFALDKN